MEKIMAMSEAQALRGVWSARLIVQLRNNAIQIPEDREKIIGALETFTERMSGSVEGIMADKAIGSILAVAMLEILQGMQ